MKKIVAHKERKSQRKLSLRISDGSGIFLGFSRLDLTVEPKVPRKTHRMNLHSPEDDLKYLERICLKDKPEIPCKRGEMKHKLKSIPTVMWGFIDPETGAMLIKGDPQLCKK